MSSDLNKYDKNMLSPVLEDSTYNYYNVKEAPFKMEGLAWFEKEKEFFRLPKGCKEKVSEAVYWLSSHPAGAQIRFRSDANRISIKVKLNAPGNMTHMTAVGQTGFDLYYRDSNNPEYTFYSATNYPFGKDEYTVAIFNGDIKELRDFVINFPLYMGVKEVLVGIEKGCCLLEPVARKDDKKIVVYGTSITQGGCASRPGMAYTNILSRYFDQEFINLGFSGSGLGELEMAELITEIDNVGMIVLDYEANGGCTGHLEKYMEQFIGILRNKYPLVPILVMTKPPFANYRFVSDEIKARNRVFNFQKNLVNKLKLKGDKNIYFYDGNKVYGKHDIYEMTVDGLHATDLGFYMMAKSLYPVFKRILNKKA